MKLWIDAQMPPRLAGWLQETFPVEANPVRDLGLRDAEDEEIFHAARKEGAVIVTKDVDFVELQERLGSPPQVLWITCGNTSNAHLQKLFHTHFPTARALLESNEPIVEIS